MAYPREKWYTTTCEVCEAEINVCCDIEYDGEDVYYIDGNPRCEECENLEYDEESGKWHDPRES